MQRLCKLFTPILSVGLLFAFLCVRNANASPTTLSFQLTNQNGGITPALPTGQSYATVTLTLNNDGTVTFNVQMASGFALIGNNGVGTATFGFNFADNSINPSDVTIGGLPSGWSSSTAGKVGAGLGTFDIVISAPPSINSMGVTNFSFTISDTSLSGGFTSLSQIGTFFALHGIGGCTTAGTACTGGTGFASSGTGGGTGQNPVPEPSSLLLLGTGLLGLGVFVRRKLA